MAAMEAEDVGQALRQHPGATPLQEQQNNITVRPSMLYAYLRGAQGTPMLPARPAYVPWVSLVDPLFLLTCLFICLSSSAVATHVSRLQITPTIVSRVENTARPTL
ncbi:hypothetical protein SNOG_06242 [Parastagonospora nodorum SN15]|uniref:Uncharacterized protein n=1 Tax=Phaeosphaeria nodorum (strain SN15 / ATCC MYA-4574 / FGSC 10173) TaxID=321614 RepID=Q0UPS2_PHANO|nr:hypothetical protein SNOG_06242 [Parastagonospora nodorum SN15]EAT86073.1 hypothetical protein SNOG_06242 [Parastagonospora nodorum SN15]